MSSPKRPLVLLLGLIFLGVMAVFFLRGSSSAGYTNEDAHKAATLIAEGQVQVLDVREPYEFDAGHIPEALLIPLGSLVKQLPSLDKEAAYLLVCRSGTRSEQAAKIMVQNGFKQVYNMRGGMLAWQGAVER